MRGLFKRPSILCALQFERIIGYLRLVTHFKFCIGSGPDNGHETALELVSGANFGRVLHHFSIPTRWNGSRGQVRPATGQKPNRNYDFYYLYYTRVGLFCVDPDKFDERHGQPLGMATSRVHVALPYAMQYGFRVGNRASGSDFGRILIGKASKSALRPAEGGPIWKPSRLESGRIQPA